MTRSKISIVSISVLALTTLSGTAIAQYRAEPSRLAVRLADRSEDVKTSLVEAIRLAEQHTNGVVIGIRLTMNEDTFLTEANGIADARERRHGYGDRDDRLDEDDTVKPGNDMPWTKKDTKKQKTASEGLDSSPMFAIVTCVIDRARVRDVVIDLSDGTVLGMQSANAGWQNTRDDSLQEKHADGTRFSLVRASELMNATARNAEDDRVGDIDELVINPESNRVIYGVLRRGGFLGFNESRYAVSANDLTVPKNGYIQLSLNNGDFKGNTGFDDEKWPTRADPEWSTNLDVDADKTPRPTRILKATDLIGTNVKCGDGQKVGEIDDLIVEPKSGRVVYGIVKSDHGRIVVPMSVLQRQGDGRVMKMTHEEFMALPTLGVDTEPDWNDASWNRRIHENFKTKMELTTAMKQGGRP